MRKRVLISGYYGCGNAGDEAVLSAMLRAFEEVCPEVQPTVLSADPGGTRAQHGVSACARMSPPALLRAIARTEVLVSGGGSLLQDVTSAASALYYLFVIRLAQIARKPVMVYAQGLGPLNRPNIRHLTWQALRRARAITVRDPASAELLERIGLPPYAVEVAADPVFGLFSAQAATQHGARVCMALRPWSGDCGVAERGRHLLSLLQDGGSPRPLLLPMHEPGDRALAEQLLVAIPAGAELVPPGLPTAQVLDRMRDLGLMVSMRLHALIFAAITGVPSVALSYDPKVEALMRLLQAEAFCLGYDAPPEVVVDLGHRARLEGPTASAGLLKSLRLRALRSAHVLREVLTGER